MDAARIIVALGRYGVQARHLRAVRAAVERETSLIEQVVAPTRRQRSPGSRERAGQTAQEIAALSLQLHASLMGSALADAGLQTDGLTGAARAAWAGESGEAARPKSGWGVRGMTSQDSPGRPRPGPGHEPAGSRRLPPAHPGRPPQHFPPARVYVGKGVHRRAHARGSASGADEDGAAVRKMEVVGVRVEMPTNQPIVLLKETQGDRYLPIWIGPVEATAIAFAQQGMVPARPLTHDLFRDVLEALEVQLQTVNITALRDGIFFADLIFSNGKEVSARPSDSIALALRTGAAIYASEEVLDEAGVAIPDEQEDEVEKFREFLDTITPEDFGRAT